MENIPVERGVDIYLRPPVGEFLRMSPFASDNGSKDRVRRRGFEPAASYEQLSEDLLIAEMRSTGLGYAIVPARGGISNEAVARIAAGSGGRYLAVGALSGNPERAAAEIETCISLKMIGCVLEPGLGENPRHLDDPEIMQICEAMAGADLALFVLLGGESGPDLSYISMPALDKIAVRFGNSLQIVVLHGGWPYVTEAIAVSMRRENVWLSPDLFWPPLPAGEQYIAAANGCLHDRMLFGSGYPRSNHMQLRAVLDRSGLTETSWTALSVDNPRRLFATSSSGWV